MEMYLDTYRAQVGTLILIEHRYLTYRAYVGRRLDTYRAQEGTWILIEHR